MHFRGLDLNLLVALDALLTEKSISRAGERVHLSQPAASGALARLREYFHDDLLVPAGRKMILTPLAEELVAPVRQMLLQAEAVINKSPTFDPATSQRKFRVVMSDYVSIVLMTQALPVIQKRGPGITVEMLFPDASRDLLERGEADLVIMPKQYLAPEHPAESLFEDEFVCVAWSGNRAVGSTVTLDEYLHLGHVVVRFGDRGQIPAMEEWFTEHFRHQRKIEVCTTGFTLVPQLLIGTTRIATIQRRLAEYYAKHLPLRILKLPLEMPKLEEAAQWHRVRDDDPGIRFLREILKRTAGVAAARASASG